MADFYQTGIIATLHRLGQGDLGMIERQLDYFDSEPAFRARLKELSR